LLLAPGRHQDNPYIRALDRADPTFYAQTFWPDGQIRVAGREFNGLSDSPCFQRGRMGCTSCHTMHADPPDDDWRADQLGAGMDGDLACVGCHAGIASDVRAHTQHPVDVEVGCMDCHMPYTTYGLLKAMRSHTVTNPDPAVDGAAGRPNACNLCHLDRSEAWAWDALKRRWGGVSTRPAGLAESPVGPRWMLAGDAGVRALVAWHAGWRPARRTVGDDWLAPLVARLLDDPYPAVRYIAGRSLRALEGHEGLDYDFLGDPRALRAAAVAVPAGPHDAAALDALEARRDDRPVMLAE
jgi:hypothetical protein